MKTASLPQLRTALKDALATTPRRSLDLRRGLIHAIRAIERAETQSATLRHAQEPRKGQRDP